MRNASTLVKPGEIVDTVILGVNTGERRMSLGLKQALGDPWTEVAARFAAGTAIEGPVVSITKFGAFIQLSEGVEGMIHVSDMSADKRINHPQEVLKVGQLVKAQVLGIDTEKRQMRLGMKQLVPSGLDEYTAEHKEGDVVTGRMIEVTGERGRVELGEGIQANCQMHTAGSASPKNAQDQPDLSSSARNAKPDLSSLGSMLQARWKSGAPAGVAEPDSVRSGQIRKFKIVKLDAAAKKIELELA
jgi:small subunit ribosomal protein S1